MKFYAFTKLLMTSLLIAIAHQSIASVFVIRVNGPDRTFHDDTTGYILRNSTTGYDLPFPGRIYSSTNGTTNIVYVSTEYHVSYIIEILKPTNWLLSSGDSDPQTLIGVNTELFSDDVILDEADLIDEASYSYICELKTGEETVTVPTPYRKQDWTFDFSYPGRFGVWHGTSPQISIWGRLQTGEYRWTIKEHAIFRYSWTTNHPIDVIVDWFDDINPEDSTNSEKELDPTQTSRGVSFGPFDTPFVYSPTETNIIKTAGTFICATNSAFAVFDWTLPLTNQLNIPIVFQQNTQSATVEISFNDTIIGTFIGSNFEPGITHALAVDISAYQGLSGSLKIELSTPGPDESKVYVPNRFATAAHTDPSIEHESTGPQSGQFSFTPTEGFEYTLHRATSLMSNSTVLASTTGNGQETSLAYDDSYSNAASAFFWVAETQIPEEPPLIIPHALNEGDTLALYRRATGLDQTFTIGPGNIFTNHYGEGVVTGFYSYADIDAITSTLTVDYPAWPDSETIYTLHWSNTVFGGLSAIGEENINIEYGATFQFEPSP